MSCIKTCDCNECEMLMINESIVFIKQHGFNEIREVLVGVKCRYTGMYAETTDKLKKSTLNDNMIFIK